MLQGPPEPPVADGSAALGRMRRWIAVAVALSAVLYVSYGLYSGWSETRDALLGFAWPVLIPVLLTTLGNYGLRYLKWVYLLRQIGVWVPHRANLLIYAIGLMMTLSPAKAGEVVKPWLVRELTGTPLARTLPVLVAERATDAIAILALAAIGVSTYASDQAGLLLGALLTIAAGLAVLLITPLAEALLRMLSRVPVLGRGTDTLRTAYRSLRTCLSPGPLLVTVALSVIAWWLECVGTWLVLRGFGATLPLETAVFLYAFATALGAISPGGVGVTDASLIEGARRLVPGVTLGTATAAALILRVATLWFGVILGAFALLRVEAMLRSHRVR